MSPWLATLARSRVDGKIDAEFVEEWRWRAAPDGARCHQLLDGARCNQSLEELGAYQCLTATPLGGTGLCPVRVSVQNQEGRLESREPTAP